MKACSRLIYPFCFSFLLLVSAPAMASPADERDVFPFAAWHFDLTSPVEPALSRSQRAWRVRFEPVEAHLPTARVVLPDGPVLSAAEQRPMAFTYSDAYNTRRTIHMYASYATLPLFITQVVAGQKLYDDNGGTASSIHDAGMFGIIALVAVNTVTGGWNMWEGRKDPNGRTRRLIHSLLMFGVDAGFAATGVLTPDDDDAGSRSLHRTVAITSMSVAAVSYVYMFFTR